MEQELSKKERKEAKRRDKRESQERQAAMRRTKKLVVWALGIGVIGFAGWLLIRAITPEPLGTDYSQAMLSEGAGHVAEGTDVAYKSNPPTSGNHWSVPLRPGLYEKEKPDQAIVHSLEHGRVWVSYKPSVSEQVKERLRDILGGRFGVILTPRPGNDKDIALAAWGRLDTFDLSETGVVDEKRVLDFVSRYLNKGPEYVPQMEGKTYE